MKCLTRPIPLSVRIPLLLLLGFLALRLPFRAEYLINWDAVNFALGTQLFNLEHHQPHPPGYIGYVAVGWLLNHITGDANTSLTLLSIIAGALAPVAFYLLASLFMPRKYAVMSAILFGLSPIVWYYSAVALSYSIELAIALFFLYFGYSARLNKTRKRMVAATILLVALGAMRQSGELFLIPLWLYAVWPFPWRDRFLMAGVLVVGNLVWLAPLLWMTGGLETYLRLSAELADLAVMPTSIFTMNPIAMGQNIGFIFGGVIVGVNLGLLIVAAASIKHGCRPFAIFTKHRIFFSLWMGPALLAYLLLHTGQLGYVLLVLPPMFLLVGQGLSNMEARDPVRTLQTAAAASKRVFAPRYAVAVTAAVLAASNAGTFLVAPQVAYAIASSDDDERGVAQEVGSELFEALPLFRVAEPSGQSALADRTRQYNVRQNDAHWENIIRFVESFHPDQASVLTVPDGAGSFRHLTYYVPDFRVYGVGRDLDNSFGHLFTAEEGTSDYTVGGLKNARSDLRLPDDTQALIIPDRDIFERMSGFHMVEVELQDGVKCAIALVPSDTVLVFEDADGAEPRIVAETASGEANSRR